MDTKNYKKNNKLKIILLIKHTLNLYVNDFDKVLIIKFNGLPYKIKCHLIIKKLKQIQLKIINTHNANKIDIEKFKEK